MRLSSAIWATLCSALIAIGCGDGKDNATSSGHGHGGAAAAGGSSSGGAGASSSNGGDGGAGTAGGGTGGGNVQRWQPTTGTSWQWQLSGLPLDLSFDVAAYDVDLFETTDAELTQLKAAGRIVICYFSAGSWEPFRPDSASFPEAVKGAPLDAPFGEELWLDIRSSAVRDLMALRLDLALTRGCDALEPDNVDGYDNNNGLGLSAADQLDFNTWIATQAHARGLSVGLKNDLGQLAALQSQFDWALNEECYSYDECDSYSDNFLAANKAVFHAEYVPAGQLANVCAVTKPLGLSTLIKHIELDAYQVTCP